jgi:hypothetical protein
MTSGCAAWRGTEREIDMQVRDSIRSCEEKGGHVRWEEKVKGEGRENGWVGAAGPCAMGIIFRVLWDDGRHMSALVCGSLLSIQTF